MDSDKASQGELQALDREHGRRDGGDLLRLRLTSAPVAYLDGALDNPDLGPAELVILLRNRAATADIVARIARNRSWVRPRAIKLALAANPRTPQVLARRFLPHLSWRDLAELSSDLRVSPVLRREAERLVQTRLPELSLGEKVTLARRGSRGLVAVLREEPDALVLQAVAGNPRATEADLERVLARTDVPSSFLSWLADRSSWCSRRGVRLALVRHPRTPSSSALRLTQTLSRRDAYDLSHDPTAPRLVRVAAERRLAVSNSIAAGSRPHFG